MSGRWTLSRSPLLVLAISLVTLAPAAVPLAGSAGSAPAASGETGSVPALPDHPSRVAGEAASALTASLPADGELPSAGELLQGALDVHALHQGLAAPTSQHPDLEDPQLPGSEDDGREAPVRTFTQPAGDLDGDGLEDFTRARVDLGTGATQAIDGHRGTDGTLLWGLDLPEDEPRAILPLGTDVTGDGIADLAELSVTVSGSAPGACTPQAPAGACAGTMSMEIHWTIGLRSGVDATQVWTHTIDGSLELTTAAALASAEGLGQASTQATFVEAENLTVLPMLLSSAGDPGAEIGVYGLGAEGRLIAEEDPNGTTTVTAETVEGRVTLLDGSSASVLGATTSTAERALPLLAPVGEQTGDAHGDLLWTALAVPRCETAWRDDDCLHGRSTVLPLALVDGATLAPVWTEEIVREGEDAGLLLALPFGADLDADGADELLLVDMPEGFFGPVFTTLLSGSDATALWSPGEGQLVPVGPIGGAPGSDILRIASGNGVYVLDRLDGATGEVLLSSERAPPQVMQGFTSVTLAFPDVDGDGVDDPVFAFSTARFPGMDTTEVLVGSSATGELVSRIDKLGSHEVSGVGDVTGDGDAELVLVRDGYSGRTSWSLFEAVDLSEGTMAWSQPLYSHTDTVAIGPFDGAPGEDVLLIQGGGLEPEVGLRAGATGEPVWGGITPSTSPPPLLTPPDLLAREVTVEPSDPYATTPIDVRAEIANEGTASTGGFRVQVAVDGEPEAAREIFPMEGSSSFEIQFYDVAQPSAGEHTVTVTVDALDEVQETDEGNNAAATSFEARPLDPVFADDMEDDTSAWSTTGQWHVTTDRSNSSSHAFYYGQENGEGLEDNTYQTGEANEGALTTPAIDLRDLDEAELRYWQHWQSDEVDCYDGNETPQVLISREGQAGPYRPLFDHTSGCADEETEQIRGRFDGGDVVHLRFLWETDGDAEAGEGWYIDDVQVHPIPGQEDPFPRS